MTEGVECRKDEDVIDETPAAYKPIEAVMAAQADLVEIVHTLRQVVCVKGLRNSAHHAASWDRARKEKKVMIRIDGSFGQGGGQILRTSPQPL